MFIGSYYVQSPHTKFRGKSSSTSCLCQDRILIVLFDVVLIFLTLTALVAVAWLRKPLILGRNLPSHDFHPETSEPVPWKDVKSLLAKIPHVTELNCSAFMVHPSQWNSTLEKLSKTLPSAELGFRNYDDCSLITSGWMDLPVSEFERQHPIAFSIMVYNNLDRFVRLLRAIYRSSNTYCVHLDAKSSQAFQAAVSKIVSCFNNVFLTEERIVVEWGMPSVLQQEMICLKELWTKKLHWEWAINLTGEEFPLKTNLELVHILTIMGRFNDVWIDPCTHTAPNSDSTDCLELTFNSFQERWEKAAAPPHFVKPYKGQIHFVLKRAMVDFILHAKTAREIYNWSLTTHLSDEVFFSTINTNIHLGAPGASTEFPLKRKPSLARVKLWNVNRVSWPHCTHYLREICLLTPRELLLLTTSKQLFANKFKPDHRPMGYACVEEWYFSKVVRELLAGRVQLDLRPYYRIYYQYIGV